MNRRCSIGFIAAATICAGGAAAAAPCGQNDAGTAKVAAVRDGRTLMLSDGRELRLAGIETGSVGTDGLRNLSDGRTLRLESAAAGTDRYGRLIAFAYLPDTDQSIQEILLNQGQALAAARIGETGCAALLLAAERSARAARRGLWADTAPLPSSNLTGIEAARGQFALVEGKVLSVRESGATVYMNFGRRWTRDFTVTVLKRQQRSFAAAGLDVKNLEGRRIRVRGWIERRGGPIIEASTLEQIEVID